MKPLPEGYYRYPVIAWVISDDVSHGERNEQNIMFENGIIPEVDGELIVVEGACDRKPIKANVIPAFPNCFKIFREDENGELKLLCYEVNGIFTNYTLNQHMQKVTE